MEIRTVLLILLAVLAAFVIVYYQYFYKNKRKGQFYTVLAVLRFCTLLSVFVVLVNPKFIKKEYFLEKANLVILTDNSSSIELGGREQLANIISSITGNSDLKERFSIEQYTFASQLAQSDSLNFHGTNTNIANAISKIDEIYASGASTILLFTDGNQTLGRDYEFLNLGENISVHPVVVGDTTQYEDISIGLVNSNTYAFLKNKFPVEVAVNYTGNRTISKTISISLDGITKFRQKLNFGSNENSKIINAVLEAESVGVKSIVVQVETLSTEKNTFNNRKEIAVEVIDEKTTVTIVSEISHPDIGAFKKSIETNEQRVVNIKKPSEALNGNDETDLFILYQPTSRFKPIYDYLNKRGTSTLTVTGPKTNWSFLNSVQTSFFKENFNQPEEIEPVLNTAFDAFGLSDFSMDNFPPLESNLGDIDLKIDSDILVHQKIRGVDLDKPLFAVLEDASKREAVLFGENIWRWRAQTYRNTQSFNEFDEFMGKLMVYLTSNGRKSRLELDYKLIFENSSEAKIRAYSFDESFSFDSNSTLILKCSSKDGNFVRELPMLLRGNYFEADLSDFPAGEYTFTVTKQGENSKRSGTFKILEFNPEKLMISANYQKLHRLAEKANGEVFYMDKMNSLVDKLNTSNQFIPIQKSRQNVVSLIDFRILLGLVVLTLSLEWFIRKFNGLI
ncbi:VWA domain-containing protein [Flagellimonas sp. S3867]|uniref:VWA domain-containing protein n=1 Tax=Flagellimonas sp. S3867 TaxID=2768063 RepID=UPI001686B5A8|nr:VWA domain-containing protein [Flagellimonas sp. S3867]